MKRLPGFLLGAALLAPVVPSVLAAQDRDRQTQRDAFTLSDHVPNGQWIRVKNLNGEIRVRSSNSDKVEISATKSWRRGNPKEVRIESRKSSDGSILVCALWTDDAVCTESSYSSHDDNRRGRDYDRDNRNDRHGKSCEHQSSPLMCRLRMLRTVHQIANAATIPA